MFYRVKRGIEDFLLNVRCLICQQMMTGKVILPLDMRISTTLRKTILRGEYEKNEMDIVSKTLCSDDRVLEFGAGIGLLSTYCALEIGGERVKTFEANPFMQPLITKTFALNGVSPALVIGAIGPMNGQLELHVRENFWASSSHRDRARGSIQTITVPMHGMHEEILAMRPTYLFIDIEGAEEKLVGSSELPGVKKVMVELHPELIGEEGVGNFLRWLSDLGFRRNENISKGREFFFDRRGTGHGQCRW